MKRALRDNAPLPYSHLIMTFMDHFGVPTDNDLFTQIKLKHRIEAEVVYTFGFIQNVDGILVHKIDEGNQEHEVREPSPPPQDSSSATLT